MTLLQKAIANIAPKGVMPATVSSWPNGGMNTGTGYLQYAREGYAKNEIVFSSIELLATSAAEPHIIGRRWRRERRQIQAQAKLLSAMGVVNRAGSMMQDAVLIKNGFFEEVDDHPLVKILNNPNPFMSRGQLWSTVVMDLKLAGNAYLLKARFQDGILEGAMGELWRLRPDRVRIIPQGNGERVYEYTVGQEKTTFRREDIVHFKTRNPFDDYYGMPPMMPLMGRVSIDNYMRQFLWSFFEGGGVGPGAILATKGKMEQRDKDEARERLKRLLSGPNAIRETLILDNAEGTTYTQMGLNRGLRDALPKEIDSMNEARIAMVFGIPGSILGLLIGYESSSYANKRQDWQVLWDVTMTPLLSDMDDVLNLSLVPEFSGIDEVVFDLSDIRALQEDEDKLQERARKNYQTGLWSFQRSRMVTGEPAEAQDGEIFFVPSNGLLLTGDRLGEEPPEPQGTPGAMIDRAFRALLPPPDVDAPRVGRPRIEDDPGARAVYDEAMALRGENPRMSWEHIAGRLGVVERTLRDYRRRFDDDD
jgi:HK97 family phage portal protein